MEERQRGGWANITIFRDTADVKAFAYAVSAPLTILKHFSAKIRASLPFKPEVKAEFIVVSGGRKSLLGRETAEAMNILRMGVDVFGIEEKPDDVRKFPIAPYPEVNFDIDTSVKPSRQYYYKIPEAFQKKVEERLEEMLKADIIEEAPDDAEWLSGLKVVMKGKNDFRLVLNMKRANAAISHSRWWQWEKGCNNEINKAVYGRPG